MMNKQPKVSIIIPVYNVEPYIEQCIKSVLGQTYRQLEVILVDDCSPDHSMDIADKCIRTSASNDLEFKCLKHENNRDVSAARNTGIKAATGEFLFFLDSDDYIMPECIELLMECVEKYPDAEMVCGGYKIFGNSKWNLSLENKPLPLYSDNRDWINEALLKSDVFHVTVMNKLVRRSFILKYELFFEEGIRHEDDIWNFEVAKHVSRIAVSKHDTYVYVIHEGSFITNLKGDLFKTRYYRMAVIKYFVNHITDPYRKRQISYVSNYIRINFPKGSVPCEFKNDVRYVYARLIKEATGRQKLVLWLYYVIPKHILSKLYRIKNRLCQYPLHIMNV